MQSNELTCQCTSPAHGHEPGKCDTPSKQGGNICEDCIAKDLPANTPLQSTQSQSQSRLDALKTTTERERS
jgi:hypothetical protein